MLQLLEGHLREEDEILTAERDIESGRSREAYERLLAVLESARDSARVLNDLAVACVGLKHYREAEFYLEKVLRDGEDNSVARNNYEVLKSAWKARKHVLILADHFWPSIGGVECYLEDLGSRLLQNGFDVEVAARLSPERTRLFHRGLHIHQFQCSNEFHRSEVITAIHELRSFICERKFDAVILLQGPNGWGSLTLYDLPQDAPRVIHLPVINNELLNSWQQSGDITIVRQLLADRRELVSITERGLCPSFMSAAGLPFSFIPHSSSRESAADFSVREAFNLRANVPLLVHIANYFPEKNHLAFLEAVRQTKADFELLLIGRPYDEHLWIYDEVLKLSAQDARIHVGGGLSREKAAAVIEEASLLVLPSVAECNPLVILEAMSCGTPWLATPECNSVLDEAGGIVVPLSEFGRIISLLQPSQAAFRLLGALGREHWERCFSWERTLPAFIKLLEQGRCDSSAFVMPAELREKNAAIVTRILTPGAGEQLGAWS
jgi:glycosyltransferase involved in cell wall biosynthesis